MELDLPSELPPRPTRITIVAREINEVLFEGLWFDQFVHRWREIANINVSDNSSLGNRAALWGAPAKEQPPRQIAPWQGDPLCDAWIRHQLLSFSHSKLSVCERVTKVFFSIPPHQNWVSPFDNSCNQACWSDPPFASVVSHWYTTYSCK